MITQIDSALITVLTAALSDILPKQGQIGICSLADPGDIVLGLHLFNIRNCSEIISPSIAARGRSIQSLPPKFITLYYLLSVFGKADAAFREKEEHSILTRAMQAFENTPVLTENELGFKPGWTDDIKLMFVDAEYDDITKIWGQQASPKLSVIYKVCPVELPRIAGHISSRVGGTDFSGGQI